MTPLAHLIKDVVDIVSDEILADLQCADENIRTINYQYGSLSEIKETLKQWSADKEEKHNKYPCIFLVLDASEQKGLVSGYRTKHRCTIGLVHHTEQQYTAQERYDNIVVPVLYPLYQNFIDNLISCGFFVAYDEKDIPHTKIDRMNMGKEKFVIIDGVAFDHLDAIEMQNLELTAEQTDSLTSNQTFK